MTGQRKLIKDLEEILSEAKAGEFGDFSNEKYPAPKIALHKIFVDLINNVMGGKYDD